VPGSLKPGIWRLKMRNIYVVNKSSHDFSPAKDFGRLIFCSEGRLNRYATNDMARRFSEVMKDSKPEDYILPCSLNIANIVAGAVFAVKHSRINLLIFKPRTNEYVERILILS
jgi:hypothetical protein